MKDLKDLFYNPILDLVAEFQGVSIEDIKSQKRNQEFVLARMFAVYCMLYMGFTTIQSGRLINKDHSTIVYYKTLFRHDKFVRERLNVFRQFMMDRGVFIPGYILWNKDLEDRGQNKHKDIYKS